MDDWYVVSNRLHKWICILAINSEITRWHPELGYRNIINWVKYWNFKYASFWAECSQSNDLCRISKAEESLSRSSWDAIDVLPGKEKYNECKLCRVYRSVRMQPSYCSHVAHSHSDARYLLFFVYIFLITKMSHNASSLSLTSHNWINLHERRKRSAISLTSHTYTFGTLSEIHSMFYTTKYFSKWSYI